MVIAMARSRITFVGAAREGKYWREESGNS